jgi:hypothetical protein
MVDDVRMTQHTTPTGHSPIQGPVEGAQLVTLRSGPPGLWWLLPGPFPGLVEGQTLVCPLGVNVEADPAEVLRVFTEDLVPVQADR